MHYFDVCIYYRNIRERQQTSLYLDLDNENKSQLSIFCLFRTCCLTESAGEAKETKDWLYRFKNSVMRFFLVKYSFVNQFAPKKTTCFLKAWTLILLSLLLLFLKPELRAWNSLPFYKIILLFIRKQPLPKRNSFN